MAVVAGSGSRIRLQTLRFSTWKARPPNTATLWRCCRFKPILSNSNIRSCHQESGLRNSRDCIAEGVLRDIRDCGVIACLRAPSAEMAIEAAKSAFAGGISVLEVTMSTPGVFEVLEYLVHEYPSLSIGVGTILQISDAEKALNLGAKFLMSPVMIQGVLGITADHALYIPGAMTPGEILSAFNAGAKIVKVYPVSALGGVSYIAAVKKPFPHIPLVASQGITLDSLDEYIARGASAVVLSDAIFDRNAIEQLDFDVITQLASLAALRSNRGLASSTSAYCSESHTTLA